MFRAVGLYIGRARVLPRQRRHVRERAFQLRFQALSRTCLRISSSQFEKEVKPTPLLRSSRSAEIDYRAEARRLMQPYRARSSILSSVGDVLDLARSTARTFWTDKLRADSRPSDSLGLGLRWRHRQSQRLKHFEFPFGRMHPVAIV